MKQFLQFIKSSLSTGEDVLKKKYYSGFWRSVMVMMWGRTLILQLNIENVIGACNRGDGHHHDDDFDGCDDGDDGDDGDGDNDNKN